MGAVKHLLPLLRVDSIGWVNAVQPERCAWELPVGTPLQWITDRRFSVKIVRRCHWRLCVLMLDVFQTHQTPERQFMQPRHPTFPLLRYI